MHFLTSALVLGTVAFQTVLGLPSEGDFMLKRDVDSFVTSETTAALNGLLCNIGSDGCKAGDAKAGIVIASPDKVDPPYFFSWTRDSALVFKAVVDRFTNQFDYGLQSHIHEYIATSAKIQGISNPAGSLADGSGLGEAKFQVDITAFTGAWGRPQRDGPALRATTMISYANWLIANGYKSTASSVIWPIVKNDLNYVAQYWNQTGFDLWEEVQGSSFFTISAQHRALVEGAAFAKAIGQPGDTYASIAPQVLCFLQSFWISSGGYVKSNINVNNGRTGKDANSVLASIHVFDPKLKCDATTFQPCSDKALSNHKALIDTFRSYNINKNIPAGSAIAIGRYIEDVYYNGNPWYLNTLAAAEQLYDALYVWKQGGAITVTGTSLAFFKDFNSGIAAGTYASDSATYKGLVSSVTAYADGFINIVAKYVGTNGALAEQFSKDNGTPLSAHDLTWSYAAFLTAAARRGAVIPPSWTGGSVPSVPGSCAGNTVQGTYASVTQVSFPPTLTPTTGAPPPPTTTIKPTTTTSAGGCPTATSVAVTFQETVTTTFGQTIKLVGNIPALGSWDTTKAIPLDASSYSSSNPVWKVTVSLAAGQPIEYKYINVASNGQVTWEKDPNRSWTVPKTCATTATKNDQWQG